LPHFLSNRHRPLHLGPLRTERLPRQPDVDRATAPALVPLPPRGDVGAIVAAMAEHQAMLDAIRGGATNPVVSEIPTDHQARADHLKAFAFFCDATLAGVCRLSPADHLESSVQNGEIGTLAEALRTRQTKTLAAGIDLIMADLKETMAAPLGNMGGHTHALVLAYALPRPTYPGEPGTDWIIGAERHRSALLGAETATVLANYLRLLGFDARAHTETCTDVDLNRLALGAGLACAEGGALHHPLLPHGMALAAVTTTLPLAPDRPLAQSQPRGPAARDPYAKRAYKDGAHPFETLTRVPLPTTYMDEPNIPRVPKRTDMFARAQFGDMGPALQKAATGGYYVRKAAPSAAQRRALGAFVLLQDGTPAATRTDLSPQSAANLIKATSHFLGVDAVGISRCPDWAWYSHDARGTPITPPHDQAISMVIDQGYETMEGSSGDDWIAVAQSMRAYLRFSLLGGVVAAQIRALGYSAKAHTVMDGEVLQPPLLLLSGLGEVSRIGEVILNPFLGPRLKSGVVTTDMPLAHDQPIDFGLQSFCEACNKCARECPSGAITAGPKRMFNGYEIWKSDSQKCTTYRVTTPGGAMCGRCMKTCPWNLEGLFRDGAFRKLAMTVPKAAPVLAKLDDRLGRGGLNPVKKWWWDLELTEEGAYKPTRHPVNARDLQPELRIDPKAQTLAVYPAPLVAHPHPYPDPMDREAGIAAYKGMVSASEHIAALARGDTSVLHRARPLGDSPVVPLVVAEVHPEARGITRYTLRDPEGRDLPEWTPGAHIDVMVAPEYLRPYSLTGDPSDRSCYEIGVLREAAGRGGSQLLHRIFTPGRQVYAARPENHFPLASGASSVLLLGGGIGITPLIPMAHALHRAGTPFALHYSGRSRQEMGFLTTLAQVPWAEKVILHISDEGTRADLDAVIRYHPRAHLYTCGGAAYMEAVMERAQAAGFPQEALHLEYFAVPEQAEKPRTPFTLRLARSGRDVAVAADQPATEALRAAGIAVDVKCSDGLCGVCTCTVISGAVEHRDFVLSQAQRETAMILCQSRATTPGGVIEVDL
jgi:reductive dehalogenase